MAMPRNAYEELRRRARYHVQVIVVDRDRESTEPGHHLWMRCRVHKVFRGGASFFADDTALSSGDTLSFSVPVRRDGHIVLFERSLSYDEYLAAKYFKVFLDGGPQVCFVPGSHWLVIEALSDRSQIGTPSVLRRLFSRLVHG